MENFKFVLFSVIIIVVLIFLGIWSFSTIESGSSHVENQKLKELTQENKNLKEKISSLNNQIIILQSEVKQEEKAIKEKTNLVTITSYKYQANINELQKLIDDKITMKRGSRGTRVGSVQKFLNIYNKINNKIDNDYGPLMETAIRNFQKDQGLGVDGQAGPSTFRKMVDLLKKQ